MKDKLQVGEKLVCQKGHVVFKKWHDKRDVSVMATNVSSLADDVEVNRGDRQVQKPVVIDLYNSSMGSVDCADQLCEYYSVGRTSYKCYWYIFWFLIDVAICNAFVLCNYQRLGQGLGKVRQLKFRTALAKPLIGAIWRQVCLLRTHQRCKIYASLFEEGDAGRHFIDKIKERKRQCVQC